MPDSSYSWHNEAGQLFRMRPMTPEDAHHLLNLFQHLGLESRFLRFNLPLADPDPQLVWAEAQRLAQIDPRRDGAWLVFTDLPGEPEAPIGGVRYIRLSDEVAEVSMTVRDDFQGTGIGTEMVRFIIRRARAAGIRRAVATVQRGNRALWRLIQKSGLPFEVDSEGSLATLTFDLTEPAPMPEA
jgi:RimJ/RimL family protein N-acetyltransferase